MRAVVQRVQGCTVSVEGSVRGRIERGALVYLGVARDDADKDVEYLVDKVANLRIFPDDNGTMNRSVLETGGEVCVVSQFTLCGDARKGRRPSWDAAAAPEQARELYESVCSGLETAGLSVKRGVFQAHMAVAYTNDGPVTILLDSRKLF